MALSLENMSLRYRYYVMVTPDGQGLVPGGLVQGERPTVGKWIDVAAVSMDFPDRYFVQYIDSDMLVPGSLIRADRLPGKRWAEVKRVEESS